MVNGIAKESYGEAIYVLGDDRMQRKVERAEAVQQVNKALTLRADNLQSDVDRLSSLLEKAAASEQIRKSLTQEEVRKMKSMATKVAQNDKRLSRCATVLTPMEPAMMDCTGGSRALAMKSAALLCR